MTEQIEKILNELKIIRVKLPELRDLFWLKVDRYNEVDQQRGVAFDEKFKRQCDKLVRAIDSFTAFVEKSFAPSAEDIAKEEILQKLRSEFPGFDGWNEEAKNALLEREKNDLLSKLPQKIIQIQTNIEKPNHGPKYQINNQPDKVYNIDSDFSHCRPCLFEFRKQKQVINNWAMLLRELAEKLYSKNSTPINEFIAKDLSKKPLFSKNPEIYLRALEIASGLYVESNFSANQMCNFCKKILDIYGIAHSEVRIYLDRIPAKM
ncbi:MAG: hypothetical protein LBR10_14165 [Prevotellaceae bacterium]|jgi:hypothetical protein|nr:hypothetical protein [Prevotellaceae bacterium]